MLAKVLTGAVLGIDAHLIEVEVDIGNGLPGLSIVGLPDKTIDEARDRIRAAIRNSGYTYPAKKMVINLAPADIRKEGTGYDLPLAIGLLAASEQIPLEHLQDYLLVGELALDGTVRPVPGVLPLALAARSAGKRGIVVPASNAQEASLVYGLKVFPVPTLLAAMDTLISPETATPFQADVSGLMATINRYDLDFSEVKGQSLAKRALEICAAGRHNALLVGPPGSGKTMLAQRFPTILPPLSFEEAIDITRIYSVAGLLPDHKGLVTTRPFRSPHHSISAAGLVGGSSRPRPGEISLAHMGVLFLDELLEFRREVLEVMRQPLEDRKVTLTRAQLSLSYPTDIILLVAMNPCFCGFHGDDGPRACSCHPASIERYWNRLSGPLLDRIDLHVEVGRLRQEELMSYGEGESSEQIRKRVEKAWLIQAQRYAGTGISCNARMQPRQIKEFCHADGPTRDLLRRAIAQLNLSGRAYDRILKIARTIADLEGCEGIASEHVAEAIQFRTFDRPQISQLRVS